MKKADLALLLGGSAELDRLVKAGLPAQLLVESDLDFLKRVVAWFRARATYRRYLDAQVSGDQEGSRSAIVDHLQGYLSGLLPTVNTEIAAALLIALQQSTAGETPTLFAPHARKRGERVESAALAACISAAGKYIVFCLAHASKRWVDAHPVKTVAELYGVDPRTASRWKERVSDSERRGLLREPDAAEPLTQAFRMVRAVMRGSALQYARFGGQAASAQRSRNRGDTR